MFKVYKGAKKIFYQFISEEKVIKGDKEVPHSQGRSWKDKIPVLGIVERESGKMFAQEVNNVKKKTLEPIIRANVKEGSTVNKWFNHQIVIHKKK